LTFFFLRKHPQVIDLPAESRFQTNSQSSHEGLN
jgi:hypothetical protein